MFWIRKKKPTPKPKFKKGDVIYHIVTLAKGVIIHPPCKYHDNDGAYFAYFVRFADKHNKLYKETVGEVELQTLGEIIV